MEHIEDDREYTVTVLLSVRACDKDCALTPLRQHWVMNYKHFPMQ